MNAVARLAHQCGRKTPVVSLHLTMSMADGRELLQLISELCPEHRTCPRCGSPSCVVCGLECGCEVIA